MREDRLETARESNHLTPEGDKGQERYTRVAVLLHWAMALLVLFLLGLGWYMAELPKGPERAPFFALHKSLGIVAFALAFLRIGWRLSHPAPALPPGVPGWQARIAQATHVGIYLLLFLQPLLGYLSASFTGRAQAFFGLPLPQWGWQDKALNDLLSDLHGVSAAVLATLIGLHLLGTVLHVRKLGHAFLRRMM